MASPMLSQTAGIGVAEIPANTHTADIAFYDDTLFTDTHKTLVAGISQRTTLAVLTGELGTGKSLLIHRVTESLDEGVHSIILSYLRFSFGEVLDFIAETFGLDKTKYRTDKSIDAKQAYLRSFLEEELSERRYMTLFVDDAQDIEEDVLIELLSFSQGAGKDHPLFGLVLVGRPYLETRLANPELRGLLPNDPIFCRLSPLGPDEIRAFVHARQVAASKRYKALFSPDAMESIVAYSQGIPRLINRLCDAALFLAKRYGKERITADIVDEASWKLCTLAIKDDRKTPPGAGDQDSVSAPHDIKTPIEVRKTKMEDGHARPSSASAQNTISSPKSNLSNQRENPMNRTERLNKVLKSLTTGSPDVEASALITEDGLMIASALPQDLDEIRVAGMSATLLNLGTRAAAELRRGEVEEVIVRGEQGYAVMIAAGRGVLLLVVANENAKLGLIFFDMRETINTIKGIL